MSAFVDKQDYKHDYKHDVDGLDDTNDWEIRKDFDHYKSIERIAEKFFSFDEKKAWDNIKRINGLQKSNLNRNVQREGRYGLKDAIDYDKVQEDIFNPTDKLKQTTAKVMYDSQEKNKAVKTVLGNEDLNKMINSHFGGRTRSKKIRKIRTRRKIKKNYKNRRSKRQTTKMER
jgi:hypothetical protein